MEEWKKGRKEERKKGRKVERKKGRKEERKKGRNGLEINDKHSKKVLKETLVSE